MQVELVSPEAVLFSGECSQVVTRTVDGDIAFLDNHAPFIGALDVGQTQLWAADDAMAAEDIDVQEAQADLQAADQALASDADDAAAALAKKWAETRIQVSGGN